MKKVALAVACFTLSAVASAEGFGVSAVVSTLGLGLDLTKGFSQSVTGRVGFNAFTYDESISETDVEYDGSLKWQSLHALADWYPMNGGFRISSGLMYNNNKATLTAKPSAGGTYTIDGEDFDAAEVGSLTGEMSFDKVAPYIGIGWGNPVAKGKSWGFVADVGVLYQNTPDVSLIATCGAAIITTPRCAALQNATAAETAQLKLDVEDYRWYPVVSVGVSYQF